MRSSWRVESADAQSYLNLAQPNRCPRPRPVSFPHHRRPLARQLAAAVKLKHLKLVLLHADKQQTKQIMIAKKQSR